MTKIAVVLFNLGGPDSKESIEPFLMNFFTDKNIIRLPFFLRWFVAKMISKRRSKREAGNSYAELGNKSPLLENTSEQAKALQQMLGDGYKVFVCMRYWHPMADEVAGKVAAYNPDKIILLPLYPQYSTTTTRSSHQTWQQACKKIGLKKETHLVCCYPTDNGFAKANAANIKEAYEKALVETGQEPRILFSAHGLPEKIVKDGDPYQWQCEDSARAIMAATGFEIADWQVCFQSRVGPMQWIGPSTEEAIHMAAKDNVPVIILPHAFTQEHVETLVEIEMEYRMLAEELGVPGFYRVPTVGTHPDFIHGLAQMVWNAGSSHGVASSEKKRLCPDNFPFCAMKQFGCKGACAHG